MERKFKAVRDYADTDRPGEAIVYVGRIEDALLIAETLEKSQKHIAKYAVLTVNIVLARKPTAR